MPDGHRVCQTLRGDARQGRPIPFFDKCAWRFMDLPGAFFGDKSEFPALSVQIGIITFCLH